MVAAYSSTAEVALEERLININNKENNRVEVESATSSSALITSAQDEHSLFEFSYLDSEDRAERELLSLPLTAIELPLHTSLTPEPQDDSEEVQLFDININNITAANSFETCAATLLTPATAATTTAVSEYSLSSYSTEGSDRGSSGSLLSTAAAIAAVQPRPTDPEEQQGYYSNNTTELPFLHQPSLSIQAPPLVSVATSASAPTPKAIVSPKLKAKRRPRANSKSSSTSSANSNKKNKKKAATTRKQSPRSKAKAISPILLPPVPAENNINISTASTSTTSTTTTRLVPKYKVNINMEEQEQALMNMNAPSVAEGQLPAIAATATAPPVPQAALSVTCVPTPTTIATNVATTTRPIAAAAAAQSNTGHPIALVPTTTPSGQPLPPKQFVPPPVSAAPATATSYVTQQVITNPPPAQQPQSSSRARAQSTASASSQSNTVTTVHPSGQVENTGRWTAEEHRLFLQGLQEHGKGWKKIATLIKSRTVVQIRTHAQKYFQKLAKARQNGETVAGVGMGTVGGAVTVTGVTVNGTPLTANGSTPMVHGIGTNENGETIGITIPVGPDGQPVVTMRTTTTPNSTYHASNMSVGCDPTSLAAAAGNVGIATAGGVVIPRVSRGGNGGGRKRNSASGGGTKRRAIGNVVRSAVREGRNVKRQRIAEGKRKSGGRGGASAASAAAHPADAGVAEAPVPNPLPAVSNVLDPYVTATMGAMPPPPAPPASAGSNAATAKKTNGRGRQQMVQTSTHGTLPMAALEDAV